MKRKRNDGRVAVGDFEYTCEREHQPQEVPSLPVTLTEEQRQVLFLCPLACTYHCKKKSQIVFITGKKGELQPQHRF